MGPEGGGFTAGWGVCCVQHSYSHRLRSAEKVDRLGREARGPQEAGGNKFQGADFFLLHCTKLKEPALILCCHDDTWFHRNLSLSQTLS